MYLNCWVSWIQTNYQDLIIYTLGCSKPCYILFRQSLSEWKIPQNWREGNIAPIHKKGSRNQVGNYKPISLTSVVCKTLEKIIRRELLNHIVENRILSVSQHGFVYRRSCMTQLLQVFDKVAELLDQGEDIDIYNIWILPRLLTLCHITVLLLSCSHTGWVKKSWIGSRVSWRIEDRGYWWLDHIRHGLR